MAQTMKSWGIPFFSARQIRSEVSDGLVKNLRFYNAITGETSSHDGWQQMPARNYVLATGKYFGGGIRLGYDQVEESIFRLPLFAERGQVEVTGRGDLPWDERGTSFRNEQAWARVGVWLNHDFRPLNKAKAPALHNVAVSGSLIGGIDFARAGMGMGLMAYLGKQSGKRLS
jgi:anaerobic glycerol-3-phosphate dehydrogenase